VRITRVEGNQGTREGSSVDTIAFAAMARTRPQAFIIPFDGVTLRGPRRIVELAANLQVPAIYQSRELVEAGGFMSYA
jgi:hypothetical protein